MQGGVRMTSTSRAKQAGGGERREGREHVGVGPVVAQGDTVILTYSDSNDSKITV
jgi:hypothetical protein